MRILALDCSQIQATVCLIEDHRLAGAETGSVDVAHSEALLPYIDKILRTAGWTLTTLDLFAVGVGPGSFTGIRIGCATIKALAQVLGRSIIPFSSLRATALSLPEKNAVALVNAYQGQVFVGWSDRDGQWHEDAMGPEQWCLRHLTQPMAACGSGVKVYGETLAQAGHGHLTLHPDVSYVTPQGVLAATLENKSKAVHYQALSANYLRPSQAEIKLASSIAK